MAQLVKNLPAMQEALVQDPRSAGKESAHNVGDLGLISALGNSPVLFKFFSFRPHHMACGMLVP